MHVDVVLWAEGAIATAMRKLHTGLYGGGSGLALPARQSAKSANLAHCMNFPARSRVVSRKSRVVTADLRKKKLLCDAYYRAASRQALPYNYPIH
ncbi:hypothetical protein E4U44_007662 [Claviceps purpurea]|nr:hypothetical protein E4U44_007662 [Claviceps purpurea]